MTPPRPPHAPDAEPGGDLADRSASKGSIREPGYILARNPRLDAAVSDATGTVYERLALERETRAAADRAISGFADNYRAQRLWINMRRKSTGLHGSVPCRCGVCNQFRRAKCHKLLTCDIPYILRATGLDGGSGANVVVAGLIRKDEIRAGGELLTARGQFRWVYTTRPDDVQGDPGREARRPRRRKRLDFRG